MLQVAVGVITLVLSTVWISREQQASHDRQGSGGGAWTLSSYAKIAVVTLFGGLLAGLYLVLSLPIICSLQMSVPVLSVPIFCLFQVHNKWPNP